MSYTLRKEEEEDDGGEILGGTGYEYFCSLKVVHRLMTQIQRRNVFDLARLPLRAK